MRDAIFTGRDVAEALEQAGRALGLSPDALRYVVLERGSAGALGMEGRPARIAVLLDAGGRRAPAAAGPAAQPEAAPELEAADPVAGVRATLARLAESARVALAAEVREDARVVEVRLSGPAARWLLEDDAEALRALDHVLQRSFARALAPRRLRLDCEGYGEQRDERLRALAQELAGAVRRDGRPRTTGALNAYERRVIHMTLGEQSDLRTYSTGEGGERRVTIAPKDEPETP
jgi:spoIIIJ-associated protein